MKFIQGKPRNQWEMYCLDTHVDADNEVRLIDLFVDSLNLSELGFKVDYEENGRWCHKANGKTMNRVKHYKTKACMIIPLFSRFTTSKNGHLIKRSEHMDRMDANKICFQENPDLYGRRQAIVEHPFKVINRQWDFCHIMTKRSTQYASSNVGTICTAYNLRRILNILDNNLHKAYQKAFDFLLLSFMRPFKAILGLGFRGKWAHSVLLTYCLDCGCAIKMTILDREMGVKWS